jgi:hypothetical protein
MGRLGDVMTKSQQREATQILAEMQIDLSDYSDEFVLGYVAGVKDEREHAANADRQTGETDG